MIVGVYFLVLTARKLRARDFTHLSEVIFFKLTLPPTISHFRYLCAYSLFFFILNCIALLFPSFADNKQFYALQKALANGCR